jgi:hypothetical protein
MVLTGAKCVKEPLSRFSQTTHHLEIVKDIRQFEVNTSVKETYELWVKNNNVLVEMKRWFGSITQNVVLKMVVGKRVDGTGTKEGE